MKEKLAEQDKQLETLKLTLKARDLEIKSDGTETAKAAGMFTGGWVCMWGWGIESWRLWGCFWCHRNCYAIKKTLQIGTPKKHYFYMPRQLVCLQGAMYVGLGHWKLKIWGSFLTAQKLSYHEKTLKIGKPKKHYFYFVKWSSLGLKYSNASKWCRCRALDKREYMVIIRDNFC